VPVPDIYRRPDWTVPRVSPDGGNIFRNKGWCITKTSRPSREADSRAVLGRSCRNPNFGYALRWGPPARATRTGSSGPSFLHCTTNWGSVLLLQQPGNGTRRPLSSLARLPGWRGLLDEATCCPQVLTVSSCCRFPLAGQWPRRSELERGRPRRSGWQTRCAEARTMLRNAEAKQDR